MYDNGSYERAVEISRRQVKSQLLQETRSVYGMSRLEKAAARNTALFLGILFGLLTISCLLLGTQIISDRQRLLHQGVNVTGTVTRVYRRVRLFQVSETVFYSFRVDNKLYKGFTSGDLSTVHDGDDITICYLPSQPEFSVVPGKENNTILYIFFGAVALSGVATCRCFLRIHHLIEPPVAPIAATPVSEPRSLYATASFSSDREPVSLNPLPGDKR